MVGAHAGACFRERTAFRSTGLLLVLTSLSACVQERLEFADWTIPPPDGTPIVEYRRVPLEERTDRIELIEDLVIGGDEVAFYRPSDLAVDNAGRIYVLDSGARQVPIFDARGQHLTTLGGPGEGPGEFGSPISVAVFGDRAVVTDSRYGKISTWSAEGGLLADIQPSTPLQFLQVLAAAGDGRMICVYFDTSSGSIVYVVAAITDEGEEVHRYGAFPSPPSPDLPAVPELLPLRSRFGFANADYAASADGQTVWLTHSDTYQVAAVAASGEMLWALRTSGSPEPFPEAEVGVIMAAVREHLPDARETDFQWATRYPAISRIAVDGWDNLYVYPHTSETDRDTLVPVDVFSPAGERIFTGLIRNVRWRTASGGFVFGISSDPVTREAVVVRYRLAAPQRPAKGRDREEVR